MSRRTALRRRLAGGWNTWNNFSVLSHVLLPHGFAIQLGIKEFSRGAILRDAYIGKKGADDEKLFPGHRSYDGSYAELELHWRGNQLKIQTGLTESGEFVALVEPLRTAPKTPILLVECGFLWNRPGSVERIQDGLSAKAHGFQLAVHGAAATTVDDPAAPLFSPYLALSLDAPAAVSTGRRLTPAEVRVVLDARRSELLTSRPRFGDRREVYEALQTCLAWDTIYDPIGERVVSPVSRIWSSGSGGWVLFCWDTYFAACMAALDNRDLAYSNIMAITEEATPDGFVPNTSTAGGFKTLDRSQPPVGSMAAKLLFLRFGDAWLLEELFEPLLRWNRWWPANRDTNGFLCWGSNPYTPRVANSWETNGVHDRFGAALESGLDNSPMYDDIPFDKSRNQLLLADVGLMGLYAMDCERLAEIAEFLGRPAERDELLARRAYYNANLQRLWDDRSGIFRNLRLDTMEFSARLSPANFYPLLSRAASDEQASRMVSEHLLNQNEFWTPWPLPSISRDDPAYKDQDYWRGRVWAPMNFLVYLGLRCYPHLENARAALADRSAELLLKEWRSNRHVHENYCPETGDGCGKENSDRFYHWGGLLGLCALMEDGCLPGPEEKIEA